MIDVAVFEFNSFAENTYVVYDETGACIIVDPGCYETHERTRLKRFIEERGLRPERLLNTHCHLDHVFGNAWVAREWNLALEIHEGEWPVLQRFMPTCQLYGIPNVEDSPRPGAYLQPGETIHFGASRLEILYTPGHSPASVSFYSPSEGFVLAGDVLFFESIGRTDLPGGDTATLLESIRTRLFTLPPETLVYPGHGPGTTVRHEMENNPFL